MKKAISNIAWENSEEKEVFQLLKKYDFSYLELAPTKIFQNLLNVDNKSIEKYLKYIKQNSLNLVAMQALLFGQNELKIFDESRSETLKYLKNVIDLAQNLGSKILVFGSPKNRLIGDLSKKEAYKIAVDFFSELGDYAKQKELYFCIEPNTKAYGCDFITNTKEAIELIKDVSCEGFKLHIDSAVMTMNEENIEKNLEEAFPFMEHFHISEAYLEPVKNFKLHEKFYKVLKALNYQKAVSIEMKQTSLSNIEQSLKIIQEIYS